MTFFTAKTFGISLATILTNGAWWKGTGIFFNLSMCLISITWFWIHLFKDNNRGKLSSTFILRMLSLTSFFLVPMYFILTHKDAFYLTLFNLFVVSICGLYNCIRASQNNKKRFTILSGTNI